MLFSWLTSATPTPPPAVEGTAPKPLTDLLPHYDSAPTTNGRAPPPPSARVVPVKQVQRQRAPVGLLDLWHYGSFVAHKATEIATDVLHHTFYGPRRKSWGLEMTLISAFMRNIGQKSHLAEINTLRALLQLGGMVPLPSDALVTPVTFRVRKRNLRGILADFDAAETGTRELSGEWVVGKKLWHRLNTEWKAQQKADNANGKAKKGHKHRVMLFIHGGAYYVFSAATHRLITIPLSKAIDARIFSLDYRLAPETKFPGPLHDAVSAYFRLIDDLHIPPENVILAGDSAGGALTLALLMYLRDNDYPLPAGAMLFSPWVDLTMSCDSWDSNAAFDVVPRPIPGDHLDPIMCYLGEGLEQYLTHPYASPLFGDFTRLPPMLIQAGEAECLRDEITLLAHKATRAGVQVQHELFEDAVHVFQMFPFLDLTTEAFKSCRNFVRHVLPLHAKQSPKVLDGPVEAELEHETGNAQSVVVSGDGQEEEGPVPDDSPDTSGTVSRQATDSDSDSSGRQDDNPSWAYAPERSKVHIELVSDSSSDDDKQSDGPRLEHRPSNSVSFPAPQSTTAPRLTRTLSSLSRAYPIQPSPLEHSQRRQRLSLHYPSSGSRKSVTDSQVFIPLDGPVPPQLSRTPSRSGAPSPPSGARSPVRRKRSPTISHSSRDAPPPAIRQTRERTQSHPDITALCVDWRARGPANITTTYHS